MMGQMKLNARVTPATLDLVRPFEPLRLQAEAQADGRWMIGYGHTRFARPGAVIQPGDADALLRYDLSETADALDTLVTAPLSQAQFEAINAFALHIGLDNFRRSTVLRSLNAGAFEAAAAAMDLWRGAGASARNPMADVLAQRRAAERAHFLGRPVMPEIPAARPEPPRASVPEGLHVEAPLPDVPAPEVHRPEPLATPMATDTAPVEPEAAPPSVPLDVPATGEAPEPPRWTPPPRPSRYLREAARPQPLPPLPPTTPTVSEDPPARVPDPLPETLPSDPDPEPALPPVVDEVPAEPPPAAPAPSVPDVPAAPVAPSGWVAPRPDAVPQAARGAVSSGITVDLPPPRPLTPAPGPTTRITYALVGLLGVMLFAGSLVSMFRQANVANLVTGLVGVAFMAPAAGHFLFSLISGRPSRSAFPQA